MRLSTGIFTVSRSESAVTAILLDLADRFYGDLDRDGDAAQKSLSRALAAPLVRNSGYYQGMSARTNSGRERLLGAAHRLFYAHGINNVGTDTVIEEAGVAKMTLYRNFNSKDDLVAAYLQERDTWWHQKLMERINEPGQTPKEKILSFFEMFAEWVKDPDFHGCAFINAHSEHSQGPEAMKAIKSHKDSFYRILRKLVADSGAEDPDSLAEQLFVLMEGGIVVSEMSRKSSPAARARTAAEALLNGHAYE
ncbi:AcrR family transcriptional regulator [Actinopolyspora biskrensis]|uniref:AcrR family transcriptional regulator n=1 Tax=Actinopolyspora biskrensis TaxID=1470178 RepID=A0A852YTB0_9ACTN|nr:TetR/AcrR family transcriptional regulator [Actinopolyspora biskrensis]NYH77340.1 AcrR family transcriptional regulator [Actinopolyspora biskrensis]